MKIIPCFIVIYAVLAVYGCRKRENLNANKSATSDLIEFATELNSTYKLSIKEASGICRYEDPNTRVRQYVVVNDRNWHISLIDADFQASGRVKLGDIDIAAEVHANAAEFVARDGSQLEGVQSDGKGNLFLLSEGRSGIIVYNVPNQKIVGIIHLRTEAGSLLHKQFKADPGSWIEGFVLLSNGHILAAKEKRDPKLVEFGPVGSSAEGYDESFSQDIAGTHAFTDAVGIKANASSVNVVDFVELKSWDPGKMFSTDLDISELATNSSGRLVMLSDQLRSIFLLEKKLKPDENKFSSKKFWHLPKAIEKPEGLYADKDNSFFIMSDTANGSKTLFDLQEK